jgi:PAS domain S-box-containing protein
MQAQQINNFDFTPEVQEAKMYGLSYKPTPSERELEWDRTKVLYSKTDAKGNILYANDAFIDVCGYDDVELIDKPHNILRHPDMPKVIFKLVWENVLQGKECSAVFKNMSKTGRYYWVNGEIKNGVAENGQVFYTSSQKSIPAEAVAEHIEPLYKKLLQIEKVSGLQTSENYLIGFLEEKRKTYFEYINSVINVESASKNSPQEKKKGFFSGFFAEEKLKK